MTDDLSDMYELIAEHLLSGKVVPILGANLCDRHLRDDTGKISET